MECTVGQRAVVVRGITGTRSLMRREGWRWKGRGRIKVMSPEFPAIPASTLADRTRAVPARWCDPATAVVAGAGRPRSDLEIAGTRSRRFER